MISRNETCGSLQVFADHGERACQHDHQQVTGLELRWADPRDHWTSQPELYCLNDMLWVIDHVDPRITYSDPATLGAAQGRDLGTLPVTTTRLERR